MIPFIMHQTAKTKDITWEERQLLRQAKKLFPDWEFRLWDDEANDQLVREHFPQYLDHYRSIRRGVLKADIARCMYLAVHGGFYADTDYKWIKRIPDDILSQKCVLTVSRDDPNRSLWRLCNSVMGSEKGYPLWRDFLAHIFEYSDFPSIPENMVEKITGPESLTDFYQKHADRYRDAFLAPRYVFHPPIKCKGFSYAGTQDSLGVHYCWGSWRTKNPIHNLHNIIVRKTTPFLGGNTSGTAPRPKATEC